MKRHCFRTNRSQLLLTALLSAILPCVEATPSRAADDWRLVWSEEFDYSGLPDPDKWVYEVGVIRNQEEQHYTHKRLENARVGDGVLTIEARREDYPNPEHQPGSDDWLRRAASSYTSASITTQGKFDFCFGRIEVRAKLPQGAGVWPAIWTLGVDFPTIGWPRCGEIDIMEFVGKEPENIHANVHYFQGAGREQQPKSRPTHKPWENFHEYGMEWTGDAIVFFFDGKPYHRFEVAKADTPEGNPYRRPHYLLLNLAMGGAWGGPIDNQVLPQSFVVDYVRVYEPSASENAGGE